MHRSNQRKEESMYLEGPVGRLEALISGIKETHDESVVGIICHPHPLYQGTMHNKVVTTVIRAWQQLGFSTVRFNFRGVEGSEGSYNEGIGEVEDLQAVFKWVKASMPNAKIWVGGFSFGAYIAAQFSAQHLIAGLITVAPALSLFDFINLKMPSCPWLIIHGEQDELVPAKQVKEWYQVLISQKVREIPLELVTFAQASHFFHGYLNDLKAVIEQFIIQVSGK